MKRLYETKYNALREQILNTLKKTNISNKKLAKIYGVSDNFVKIVRKENNIPAYKVQKPNNQNCKGCVHFEPISMGGKMCGYILNTGKPRGCDPLHCDKYSKDKSLVRMVDGSR